jgi:hypothetical protein
VGEKGVSANEGENPYAAPSSTPAAPTARPREFHAPSLLVVVLCGVLVLFALLTFLHLLLAIAVQVLFSDASTWVPDDTSIDVINLSHTWLLALSTIIYLVAGVLFLFWIVRAAKNARALGATGQKNSPGWCAGWFFIPIANFWKPYQAVCEVYRASDPESDGIDWWHAGNYVPARFAWWWAAWIGASILSRIESRMARSSDDDFVVLAEYLSFVTLPLALASAVLCVSVIRAIDRRQELKLARITTTALPHEGGDRA